MADARDINGGAAVDAKGRLAADPTLNVREMFDANSRRIDEVADLQTQLTDEKIKRMEDNGKWQEKIAVIRSLHATEIRLLESRSQDKTRQVDVLAGNTAQERAQVAIQTLASQNATERETLRSLVASTAATIAAQLAGTISRIDERIGSLEKSSYTGLGKQGVTDPQFGEAMQELRSLGTTFAQGKGKGEGISTVTAILISAATLLLLGLGTAAAVITVILRFSK